MLGWSLRIGLVACLGAGLAVAQAHAQMTDTQAPHTQSAEQGPELEGLAPVDSLSPVEMMEEYRARCGGGAGRAASDAGAEAARTHGQRCDALARAIQGINLDDRRAGSADLARPDFYMPGEE